MEVLCGLRMEEGGTRWEREHLRRKRASVRPPHVVLPIGEHVKKQTDGYCPAPPRQVTMAPIGQTAHEGVEHNGGIGMEGMKADAHAVGREDGCGQQVVEIDKHGGEHDEIGFAALAVGKKQQCKEERGEEMQAVVDDGAEGVEVHGRDDLGRWDGWDVDGGDTQKAVGILDGRGDDKSKVTHFLHARDGTRQKNPRSWRERGWEISMWLNYSAASAVSAVSATGAWASASLAAAAFLERRVRLAFFSVLAMCSL